MRYPALGWFCVCALALLPFSASGCGPAQEGDGDSVSDRDVGGTGGVGAEGGIAGSGGFGGAAGQSDLCAGVTCDDQNDCTVDGDCDPKTGRCVGAGIEPLDTPCGPGGAGYCNDSGECVVCNRSAQCPPNSNVCTSAICENGSCGEANEGGDCDHFGAAGVCENGVCVDADLCDPYPCQEQGYCRTDHCNPSTGHCTYGNDPDGTICFANGYAGECQSGACDLCAPVNCNDGKQCTIDGTCNPATGQCDGAGYALINTACNQSGGQVCDGGGNCVGCNDKSQCNDDNPCTIDSCSPVLRLCSNTRAPDGTLCGASSVCLQGTCSSDALGRVTYTGDRGDLVSGSYNGIARVWEGFHRYGLSGFYLNFTGSGVDHEIERIMPGFFRLDFSSQVPGLETVLFARYEDGNADDPYTFAIDAQKLPYGSTRHSYANCSTDGGFSHSLGPIEADVEPVLLGFDLNRGSDWNLESIEARVFKTSGSLYYELIFEDEGTYNSFCYSVHYALIPQERIRAYGHYEDTTSRKGTYTRSIAAIRPVLQGFKLRFTNGDHHVDQVGVRALPGEIRLWMNDKNNDDPFRWEAWWLDLE